MMIAGASGIHAERKKVMNVRRGRNGPTLIDSQAVILALALFGVGAMLLAPASIARGATCGPIVYGADFSSLPPGAGIFGSAQIDGGVLKLTEAVNAQSGTFVTPNFGWAINEFTLMAQIRIGDSTCCLSGRNQLRPADGISFNFAPDITLDTDWSGGATEEGVGSGLRVTFDTWDNGDPDTAPAIELMYNGVTKAVAGMDGWRDNNTPDAGYIPLDPQNGAPLTLYTDARDQTMVEVTNGPSAGRIFQCHQGDTSLDLALLPGGELAGPTVYVGLAGPDETSVPPAPGPGFIALVQRGIYTFHDKAQNTLARGYAGMVVFNDAARGDNYATMGMQGFSDFPAVMVGHSRGLEIAGVSSAAELVVGNPGADVAMRVSFPTVAPYGEFRWTLRPDGTSDVWWKGVKVIDNVQTGFVPAPGRFGFGARTGGGTESHWIDEFAISSYATATSETGTRCYDGIDNDCDFLADAADPDCAVSVCDVDGDGDIDQTDLSRISSARGRTALPGDPRDADKNGLITPNDVKVCIPQCTRPNCAVACRGSIGDFVWHDQNRNGLQNSGEPGIDGVAVKLYKTSDLVNPIAVTTTGLGPLNQHGYFQFTGLCAGDYKILRTTPAGFSPTSPCSSNQTIGNDSNCSPAPVNLATNNSTNQTIDFGFVTPCTGRIGDWVWEDQNRNGVQDSGEPGINGVVVKLFRASDLANPIAVTTTANGPGGVAGYYQFTGLCALDYAVTAVTPDGLLPTVPNVGGDAARDSNDTPALLNLPTDNSSDQTIDFGFVAPACIGDYVWYDRDADGIQDAGEPGISQVSVQLSNCTATPIAVTTTDANGFYQFCGLMPGGYQVKFIAPPGTIGHTFSPQYQGGNPALDSNANSDGVTECAQINQTNVTIDAGLY
jgi:hypothetical protein